MDPWKRRSLFSSPYQQQRAVWGCTRSKRLQHPATRVSKTGLGLTEDGLKASVLQEMPLVSKDWWDQLVCQPAGWVFSTCILVIFHPPWHIWNGTFHLEAFWVFLRSVKSGNWMDLMENNPLRRSLICCYTVLKIVFAANDSWCNYDA